MWGKYLQIRIIINIIAEDMTCRLRILSKKVASFQKRPTNIQLKFNIQTD